jgi:xylulose-5-phosphate/fructose-6-phosphate phosphoketolase
LRRWFVTGGDPALRRRVPDLKIRVVNVVDLTSLQPPTEQPHGISEKHYDSLFTADRPIIFNYHGYPWPIQRLVYRRTNQNLRVRGYKEEDTTTTPFGMCVLNQIDRFNLAIDVIDRVPKLSGISGVLRQELRNKPIDPDATCRPKGKTCRRFRSGVGRSENQDERD